MPDPAGIMPRQRQRPALRAKNSAFVQHKTGLERHSGFESIVQFGFAGIILEIEIPVVAIHVHSSYPRVSGGHLSLAQARPRKPRMTGNNRPSSVTGRLMMHRAH